MRQIISERSAFTSGIGTSTVYLGFPGSLNGIGTVEIQARATWMVAGTFRNFYIEVDTAPGSGKTRTITVQKNGSPTSVTVTLSDAETSGSDLSNSFTVSPGDYLSLEWASSGSPTNTGGQRYSIEFESDNAGESGYAQRYGNVLSDTNPAKSGVFWCCYQGSGIDSWNATHTDDEIGNIVPCDGTITGTSVLLNQSPGGGTKAMQVVIYHAPSGSGTFTKQDGSGATVDTRVTCSNTTTANTGTYSLPVSAGDRVYCELIPQNTPNALGMLVSVGFRFEADTDGESIMGGFMRVQLGSNGTTQYFTPQNAHDDLPTSEGTVALIGNPAAYFQLGRFYGHLESPPGTSETRTFTVRLNAASPASPLEFTIADTEDDGSDLVGTYDIGIGDEWELMAAHTSGAANSVFSFSLVQTQAFPPVVGSSIFGEDGTIAGLSRVHLLNLDGVTRTLSDTDLEGSAVLGGNLTLIEQATPPVGVANTARIFAVDNGAGKTRLMVQFGSGTAIELAIEA